MPQCRNFMSNLCDEAALPFQALNTINGTWSIDFVDLHPDLLKNLQSNQ